MGRVENVAPATAEAAASGQTTAKSASHARRHDLRCLSARRTYPTSTMRIIVSEYRSRQPAAGCCALSPTPMKYKQSHTQLDKTEATNACVNTPTCGRPYSKVVKNQHQNQLENTTTWRPGRTEDRHLTKVCNFQAPSMSSFRAALTPAKHWP